MLVSSTTPPLCQILSSPLLLPVVKVRQCMFSKPLQSPAGTTLKGTLLSSEGELKCQGAGSADPRISCAGHSPRISPSYQGSANEACTAGIPPQDGGTWPLPPRCGTQARVGTSPPLSSTCTFIPQHAVVQGYLFQKNNETA